MMDTAQFARDIYNRFNSGDLIGARALAHEDAKVELVALGQSFDGPDGFMTFMEVFKTAFPDIKIEVENQVATADAVVNVCTWAGTHSGSLMGPVGEIPPTGKRVTRARFCEVWKIEDGRLSRLANYQDVSTWMRELGLVA
jgi:steroid delta-isomerase-like uncharacterized protein